MFVLWEKKGIIDITIEVSQSWIYTIDQIGVEDICGPDSHGREGENASMQLLAQWMAYGVPSCRHLVRLQKSQIFCERTHM